MFCIAGSLWAQEKIGQDGTERKVKVWVQQERETDQEKRKLCLREQNSGQ